MKNVASKLYHRSLLAFAEKAFRSTNGDRLDSQSYIAHIVHKLELLLSGDIRNLLINLPGRHLKTFLCSVCFPAFALGHDPGLKFMVVAYDERLAEDIVRQIREIMESDWYKSIFDTRISSDHSLKNDFGVKGGGRVRAVSIRSITGKGGDIIIFDDPHNVHDWNNDYLKQKTIGAFELLRSRRDGGVNSQMIVVGHRIAGDDLSAYILEHDEFNHVCLPLLAPKAMSLDLGGGQTLRLAKDETLRPNAYPPEEIETLKKQSGPRFSLYYMQGLGSRTDDYRIEISDFRFFTDKLGYIRDAGFPVVLSVDPAQCTNSSSRNVIQVYAVVSEIYVLLDVFAEKCSFDRLLKKTKALASRYDASVILVEKTARGSDLIDQLRARTQIPIHPMNPRGSKSDRLRRCAPIIWAKRIMIVPKAANEDAIKEIVAHPDGPYDDNVDAMTNFLLEVSKLRLPLRTHAGRSALSGIALARGSASVSGSGVQGMVFKPGRSAIGNSAPPDFRDHRAVPRSTNAPCSPYNGGNDSPHAYSFDGKKIIRHKPR
jgi:phage terminase large subunit-like protein